MPDFYTFFYFLLENTIAVLTEPLFTLVSGGLTISVNILSVSVAVLMLFALWTFLIPRRS